MEEKIFQLMEKMYTELSQRMENMHKDINNFKNETKEEFVKVNKSLARIEQDHGEKITALFDGYNLRGDQITNLQEHLDERLDVIQIDLSYVVNKVAQHERNIINLNKKAK